MKDLTMRAGGAALLIGLASCGIGFGASRGGEAGAVIALRDLSLIILALYWLITTLILGGLYFALAWAVGRFGPRLPKGLHWVGGKVGLVEHTVERGAEQYVVRPVARVQRTVVTGVSMVRALVALAQSRPRFGALPLESWGTFRRWRRGRVAASTEIEPTATVRAPQVTEA